MLPPAHRNCVSTAGQRDGTRLPAQEMISFIRCPAGYCAAMLRKGLIIAQALVSGRSAKLCRSRQDVTDSTEIRRVHDETRGRYGARKVWHQLHHENKGIARCTVERLIKVMGLQRVVRGKSVITTNPDASRQCLGDKVNREFKAQSPNQLWVSDFTYVSTWQGMVYVAFVGDVFSRRIVGWRVSASMTTAFVLDVLNQAIGGRWDRSISRNRGRFLR